MAREELKLIDETRRAKKCDVLRRPEHRQADARQQGISAAVPADFGQLNECLPSPEFG